MLSMRWAKSGALKAMATNRDGRRGIGIKDATDDFVVIAAQDTVPAAGVFTQSRFAGPSVGLSRRAVADGMVRAFVVVSKNANVANGRVGHDDADDPRAGEPLEARLAGAQILQGPGELGRALGHALLEIFVRAP